MRNLLISALLVAAGLSAAEKWTVDDILFQERAGGPELSRDGKFAVYTKTKMDREKGEAVTHLYLKYLDDDAEIQLTRGQDSAQSPKISPDGRKIAFLTSRKAPGAPSAPAESGPTGSQIWLLDTRGGEPYALTKLERGVRTFDWLSNNELLAAAPEDPSLYAQKVKERKDSSQVVDDETNEPPVRLFRIDAKSGKASRVTTNTDRITNLWVSPDGQWAVTTHNRSLAEIYNQKIKPVAFLHDLKNNQSTQLFSGTKLLLRSAAFTTDNKGFYFTSPYTTHPYLYNASVTHLYWFDLATRQHRQVNLDWENGLAGFGGPALTPDGFVALLASGARNKAARYTRKGDTWARTMLEGDHVTHLHAINTTDDGTRIIYTYSNASTPATWQLGKLEGHRLVAPKTFVEPNAGWKNKPRAKTELVYWKGALDEEVEGILYYPHNYESGKKYPLVVMIHGGPHGHDSDNFNESWGYPHNLFAQRGAFVLKPNYHGSSGYGLKWGESISGGKYNDLEWIDVERGVDSLIAKGLADPGQLGVLGWSNGSIITIELTTRTTRYKAAGAGAGDVNWISDWGNAVFGDAFEQYYLGKTPMDDPMFYVKKSPLFRMDKVTTPTIIFFGTEDKQVPTEQGWQHYRALQHYGKTDVKFILFPGEAHGPRKLVHQRRKLEEELAWFDKHLFKTSTDRNEALKVGSPLEALTRVARQKDVPDTVDKGKFAVGRFEVTRAQFKAFDPSFSYAPGTDYWPANNIPFERAKAYCEWLSKKTGETYRLGTEEELGSLLTASKTENTLDLWAGYSVNPDDARKLASLIDATPADAMLKPVGSFPGAGDDPVFDLGGNVAEWVVAKDGKPKAMGGSADQPVDAKTETKPRPAYVGFRVVKTLAQ
jgi:dipeptidyl aminopeptidase/acylaminoacyl peptidase